MNLRNILQNFKEQWKKQLYIDGARSQNQKRSRMDTSLEKNKQIVRDFYETLLNRKDFDAAAKYIGRQYIQHNPNVGDGITGLKEFFDTRNREFPESRVVLKRVLAEGDYVVCHVHSLRIPDKHECAAIDIFRLEDGKICEHWDAVQEIPRKAANSNSMF